MKFLCLLLLSGSLLAPAIADPCFKDGEHAELLALDAQQFDQTPEQGWRLIAELECYAEAAGLIGEYRANTEDQRVSETLRHHQVQMHAAAEERPAAISLLDEMIAEYGAEQPDANLYYWLSTRAFLAGDTRALEEARAALAGLPMPDQFADAVKRFEEKYPDFAPPSWPPNLDTVDGFLNCFDETYHKAYGEECRTQQSR